MNDSSRKSSFKTTLRLAIIKNSMKLMTIPLTLLIVIIAISYISDRISLSRTSYTIKTNLDAYFESIDKLLYSIQESENFWMLTKGEGDVTKTYKEIYSHINQLEDKDIVFCLDTHGSYIFGNTTVDEKATIEKLKGRLLLSILDSNDNNLINVVFHDRNRNQIYLIVAQKLIHNEEECGYLCYMVNMRNIEQICTLPHLDYTVVTDIYNNVVYTSTNNVIGAMGKYVTENAPQEYSMQTLILENDMTVKTGISIATKQQFLVWCLVAYVSMLIMMVAIIRYNSKVMAQELSADIDDLMKAVDEYKNGNWKYKAKLTNESELAIIADNMGKMAGSIENLIRENFELTKLNQKIEYKQLEDQFHPHFVNNALETIRVMVKLDPEHVSDIIFHLANYMRFSTYKTDNSITLREELEHVNDYLTIYKYRFGNNLQYDTAVDPLIMETMIPKNIIQPIVENSIKHGFSNNTELKLKINGIQDNNQIIIIVEDNGEGMTEEKLETVIQSISGCEEPKNHIGLYNISRRLRIIYNQKGRLEITSKYYGGTKTTITIPKGEGYV